MIGLAVVYVFIGLWLARASAEFINQKNIRNHVMIAGEMATWTSNFWTWLLVVAMPLFWITMPVIMAVAWSSKVLNEAAVWAGRELSNPRNNIKEIEND